MKMVLWKEDCDLLKPCSTQLKVNGCTWKILSWICLRSKFGMQFIETLEENLKRMSVIKLHLCQIYTDKWFHRCPAFCSFSVKCPGILQRWKKSANLKSKLDKPGNLFYWKLLLFNFFTIISLLRIYLKVFRLKMTNIFCMI